MNNFENVSEKTTIDLLKLYLVSLEALSIGDQTLSFNRSQRRALALDFDSISYPLRSRVVDAFWRIEDLGDVSSTHPSLSYEMVLMLGYTLEIHLTDLGKTRFSARVEFVLHELSDLLGWECYTSGVFTAAIRDMIKSNMKEFR